MRRPLAQGVLTFIFFYGWEARIISTTSLLWAIHFFLFHCFSKLTTSVVISRSSDSMKKTSFFRRRSRGQSGFFLVITELGTIRLQILTHHYTTLWPRGLCFLLRHRAPTPLPQCVLVCVFFCRGLAGHYTHICSV